MYSLAEGGQLGRKAGRRYLQSQKPGRCRDVQSSRKSSMLLAMSASSSHCSPQAQAQAHSKVHTSDT